MFYLLKQKNKYRVFLSVVTHPFHAGAAAKPRPGAGLGAAGQAQADNGEARVAVGPHMCGHPYPDHDCRRLYVCRGECGKYPLQASVPVRHAAVRGVLCFPWPLPPAPMPQPVPLLVHERVATARLSMRLRHGACRRTRSRRRESSLSVGLPHCHAPHLPVPHAFLPIAP